MTATVGSFEAKTHLPRLLDQVEQGDTITITKYGRPVARLVPVSPEAVEPGAVIDALRMARAEVHLDRRHGAPTIREMIEEGRR